MTMHWVSDCSQSLQSPSGPIKTFLKDVKTCQSMSRHFGSCLRWLGRVFQGQYFSSLSKNYVVINRDLEKLTPQLYWINMKICYDQGYNDSEVVMATIWLRFLYYLQLDFLALGKSFKKNLCKRYRHTLGWIFYGQKVGNTVKTGQSWCSAFIRGNALKLIIIIIIIIIVIIIMTIIQYIHYVAPRLHL